MGIVPEDEKAGRVYGLLKAVYPTNSLSVYVKINPRDPPSFEPMDEITAGTWVKTDGQGYVGALII